jgi:Predicted Zn-dependent peptidases
MSQKTKDIPLVWNVNRPRKAGFHNLVACAITLGLIVPSMIPPALAEDAKTEPVSAPELKIPKPIIPVTKEFTLENGLRVLVSEDHSVPVSAAVLIYDVGARDEKQGKSGFAHLFEHMMFEGSRYVPKGAFFKYVQSAGGQLNASTHPDFTDYYESLPSNQIPLSFWLESDRMRSLAVTDETFKNQQETVKEEKRLRIDNQPYMPAALQTEELIFDNWTNKHPVIGYLEDLNAATTEDVKKFFNTYYAPNNCTMAVVGDVDSAEIEKLVRKYFASIPKQPEVPTRPDTAEPRQEKPKYLKVVDKHAKLPAFWMAWKAPARRDPDSFVMNLIQNLLTGGTSSRLYQKLIKVEQIAVQVSSSYDERRGPSEMDFFAVLKPGVSAEKVRQSIIDELNKLKKEPILDSELQKTKNQTAASYFASGGPYSLQKSLGRAEMLAQYAAFYKDPSLIDKDLESYLAVTKADIQRVAEKYFFPEGVTVVDVVPADQEKKTSSAPEQNKQAQSNI